MTTDHPTPINTRNSVVPLSTEEAIEYVQAIPPMPGDLRVPDLTENANEVMRRRICIKNDDGEVIETPAECFWRVAWVVSGGSYPLNDRRVIYDWTSGRYQERYTLARQYYDLMASRKFMPNSPCLVNAGRPLGQLSACFVLPVPDSIDGIFNAVRQTALIHQSGGGTGFSFSDIRPKNSPVRTTNGVASGPVTFMQVFDKGTWAIKQGATRRGANMGILHIDHPDIMEFIELKSEIGADGTTPLENFNVSVAATDEFMEIVLAGCNNRHQDIDCDYHMPWKQSGHTPDQLWTAIINGAWRTGDPGVIFIDKMNSGRSNPMSPAGWKIKATNPCGEQPLYDYDSCNLGSINIAAHMDVTIDQGALGETVRLAVRFLDDVITVNKYALPEIDAMTKQIRRIGLGVMGWADALIELGWRYDSRESLMMAAQIAEVIQYQADVASTKLGSERGSFPRFSDSIYATKLPSQCTPMRNSTRTTIAPTGTISIIAGCSSGIEPGYAAAFMHQHKLDQHNPDTWHQMYEVNQKFREYLEGFFDDDDLGHAAIQGIIEQVSQGVTIGELIDSSQLGEDAMIFAGANEIEAAAHVQMQAMWQKFTDNAVSKTVNLPRESEPELISKVYMDAYETGCKGITIYRDGCRDVQVMNANANKPQPKPQPISFDLPAYGKLTTDFASGEHALISEITEATMEGLHNDKMLAEPPRLRLPEERAAITHHFRIGDAEGYLTVGLYPDGTAGELFVNMSKQGSTVSGLMDSFAIMVSGYLQRGVRISTFAPKFIGMRFDPSGPTSNAAIPFATSPVDYIMRWLDKKFNDPSSPATAMPEADRPLLPRPLPIASNPIGTSTGQACPDCGSVLRQIDGCAKCISPSCGYSEC